jgi:hypothetical protein
MNIVRAEDTDLAKVGMVTPKAHEVVSVDSSVVLGFLLAENAIAIDAFVDWWVADHSVFELSAYLEDGIG